MVNARRLNTKSVIFIIVTLFDLKNGKFSYYLLTSTTLRIVRWLFPEPQGKSKTIGIQLSKAHWVVKGTGFGDRAQRNLIDIS